MPVRITESGKVKLSSIALVLILLHFRRPLKRSLAEVGTFPSVSWCKMLIRSELPPGWYSVHRRSIIPTTFITRLDTKSALTNSGMAFKRRGTGPSSALSASSSQSSQHQVFEVGSSPKVYLSAIFHRELRSPPKLRPTTPELSWKYLQPTESPGLANLRIEEPTALLQVGAIEEVQSLSTFLVPVEFLVDHDLQVQAVSQVIQFHLSHSA